MGKKIPMWQCVVTILFTILVLMYVLGILGLIQGKITGVPTEDASLYCDYGEVHIALLVSCIFASIVAIANGYKWAFLEAGILASINRSMQAMLILMTVGSLIGSWVTAGVVPAMIYYGLMILKPSIFLMASCILCSIVALATGSSWTTAGTIGIALIGVGTGLGISVPMTAGAIVSGAYFGDKMSPLSDTTNLAPAMAGSTLFDHIKHMLWTVTPSLIFALVLYTILGLKASGDADMSIVSDMQEALKINFVINPAMLIPPVVVILIVALKLPALPGLMGGIVLGCIIGSVFQGVSLAEWPGILHYGYNIGTVSPEFAAISDTFGIDFGTDQADFAALAAENGFSNAIIGEFNIGALLDGRGGMDSMMWTINLIICAMCFGGVMDASGMLGTLATALLKLAKNTGMLVTVTVFSCIFMNIIAGDQYLALVLPGRMFKEAFEDRKLAPKNLSRCLEDSGTITSNLVPWNTCGATMSTFLGVGQWGAGGYAPYAFLCWFNPLVSIFYGFTGISMTKMTDEEYDRILEARAKEKEEAMKALEA
jgi:NhaC family Na+:H+ antiporter